MAVEQSPAYGPCRQGIIEVNEPPAAARRFSHQSLQLGLCRRSLSRCSRRLIHHDGGIRIRYATFPSIPVSEYLMNWFRVDLIQVENWRNTGTISTLPIGSQIIPFIAYLNWSLTRFAPHVRRPSAYKTPNDRLHPAQICPV